MQLTELIARAGIEGVTMTGGDGVEIADITTDSRSVKPASLFIAVPGTQHQGAHYIPAALKQGAAALLIDAGLKLDIPAAAAIVRAPHVRAAVAKLAAAFFTPQPYAMVAVTGTDGKTSTADFARQLFTLTGHASASMGTLGLLSDHAALNEAFAKNNTSPEPVLLHRTLTQLAMLGTQYVAIEASSHGLDQHRLHGANIRAAAFTNLTRDHLDYHGTMEAYAEAKRKLFSEVLMDGGTAVIHADDPYAEYMASGVKQKAATLWRFGRSGTELKLRALRQVASGLEADLDIFGARHSLALPLYGAFQMLNILAAIGLCAACDIAPEKLIAQVPHLVGVKGRLERVASLPNGALCFVDYAHTPAALENILRTLRPHTSGKLYVVFGCGGDRDTGKRPEMGKAAATFADSAVVTDDNPRSENPAAIRAAILAAAPEAKEIPDRAEAIARTIEKLNAGDTLVVAGKGHENYQIIGAQTLPFDDAEIIRSTVRTL